MISREELDDLEKAEQQIDVFISKRAEAKKAANAKEAAWAESVRRFKVRRRERNRELWCAYHLDRAECLERTAAELAASHRSKAEALANEGEGVEAVS
jgi:hypothetical protein